MPAYVLSMMSIHDPATFRKYTDHTPPTVAKYGGKFLARGKPVETLEGEPYKGRLVILEFPDMETARAWCADPLYQELSQHRREASTFSNLYMIEGDENTAAPDAKV